MYVAINKVTIGYTRDQGYLLYNTDTFEFIEYSTSEVARMLKKGGFGVCGLKLENGKIVLDEAGYNQVNMMVKSSMSMGRYRLMKPGHVVGDRLYSVVRAIDTPDEGLIYEVVSNTCARVVLKEDGIRRLFSDGVLSGLWIDKYSGQITLADSIPIIDICEFNNGGEGNQKKEEKANADTDISESGISSLGSDAALNDTGNEPNLQSDVLVKSDKVSEDEETYNPFDSIEDILKDGELFNADEEQVKKAEDSTAYIVNDEMSQVGDGYVEREEAQKKQYQEYLIKESELSGNESAKAAENDSLSDEVDNDEKPVAGKKKSDTSKEKKKSASAKHSDITAAKKKTSKANSGKVASSKKANVKAAKKAEQLQ